ncbi:MAG: hypothetical protein ABI565_00760 [Vicinamibacteria bacterium]
MFFGLVALPALVAAQAQAPAPSPSPMPTPDDTPALRVGATIFSDFTYTESPQVQDADGNLIHANAFDVSRAYLNLTGALSHLVSFRATADVKRLTSATSSPATALDGTELFRLKYAYGQIGLDRILPKGSWVRIGLQQTPLVDYEEGVYRYRFQGTAAVEREGFLSSSDFGISGRLNLPGDRGDIHLGVYNGESYVKGETNDQKAFQIRGTVRPLPGHAILRGLRLTAFYDADKYVKGAPRTRFVANVVFEHKHIVAGADFIQARDRTSARAALIESSAYSIWARPRTSIGIEALLRYDSFKPNKAVDARKSRTIVGAAYWFKTQAPVSVALLADYERVTYAPILVKPREGRMALHCLFAF